jgi:hypothetical protein
LAFQTLSSLCRVWFSRTTSFNDTLSGTINNFPLSSGNIYTESPSSDSSLLWMCYYYKQYEYTFRSWYKETAPLHWRPCIINWNWENSLVLIYTQSNIADNLHRIASELRWTKVGIFWFTIVYVWWDILWKLVHCATQDKDLGKQW